MGDKMEEKEKCVKCGCKLTENEINQGKCDPCKSEDEKYIVE